MRTVPVALVTAVALCAPVVASAAPIAPSPVDVAPGPSTGAAVTASSVPNTDAPQNPFMAANPKSNIHNDTWMTDAYAGAGPLGRSPKLHSSAKPPSLCGSIAFDKRGRIMTVCPSSVSAPEARIIDPRTLETIATFVLPTAPDPPGTEAFQNFTGGGYFFLDAQDRIVVATKTRHVVVIAQGPDGRSLKKVADYDLTPVLSANERISSALPDFTGRLWFVSKKSGKVGTIDPKTKKIRVLRTGEEIQNSFAVDRDATYVVSDKRMYRMSADATGKPKVDWKVTYDNDGVRKPGQVNAGSGTTPTIMQGGYVAIADNDDPLNVVVYRTAKKLRKGAKRTVCAVPVFAKGASATENSLITFGRALIIENNFGYQTPFGPRTNEPTVPGFARVDVKADGSGCVKRWTNTTEAAPSLVPKLSTKTGLVYAYTRDIDAAGTQRWSWTAIDATTGRTRWERYVGAGFAFNNNYAGAAIGPDATLYLGVIGGLISLRDGG